MEGKSVLDMGGIIGDLLPEMGTGCEIPIFVQHRPQCGDRCRRGPSIQSGWRGRLRIWQNWPGRQDQRCHQRPGECLPERYRSDVETLALRSKSCKKVLVTGQSPGLSLFQSHWVRLMRYRHGPMFLQLIFQLLQESLQRPPNHVTKFFQRLECVRGRLCPHLSRSAARSHKQSPRPVTKPSPLLRSLRIQRKAPGKPAAEPSDTPQPATDPDPATPCPGRKDPFILPIRSVAFP